MGARTSSSFLENPAAWSLDDSLVIMGNRYQKHYTRDQATDWLPKIRSWLSALRAVRNTLDTADRRLVELLGEGRDCGGRLVDQWVRGVIEFKLLLDEFERREIQLKDLDRGLVDFPSILAGKEVFLCWEDGEDKVEYWHEIESGYQGRHAL